MQHLDSISNHHHKLSPALISRNFSILDSTRTWVHRSQELHILPHRMAVRSAIRSKSIQILWYTIKPFIENAFNIVMMACGECVCMHFLLHDIINTTYQSHIQTGNLHLKLRLQDIHRRTANSIETWWNLWSTERKRMIALLTRKTTFTFFELHRNILSIHTT